MLSVEIELKETPTTQEHNTATVKKLDQICFSNSVENKLSHLPQDLTSDRDIDVTVNLITDAITQSFRKQGKIVKTNSHRHKAWWDEEKLRPLLRERNRARRWMILSKTYEAACCYWDWNNYVKFTINDLKRHHWRVFLAKAQSGLTFKAFKYTQAQGSNTIAPLYRADRTLATDKDEQAKLLFTGASVVENLCDTSDIAEHEPNLEDLDHPPIPQYEVAEVIRRLPTRKATGGDGIPNELIKFAESSLTPTLTRLFNTCLTRGYFPKVWRTATTAILRKHDKEDYSEAGAYRPIALLSCLGKVFETIIAKRVTYWAEMHKVLAQGHMGGRRQHSTDDAFVILTSWIHHKWREGKIVSGLFLDVKSAYPSVHKQRLADTLRKHDCPEYLVRQVEEYLDNRTTDLRLQDFISEKFEVEDGLPQGSPLSVILYILYNSSLLINIDVNTNSDRISLGFIDDITHLVANKDVDVNVLELEEEGDRALAWGKTHGAIFDQKKAQIMHFTHRRHSNPKVYFGNQILESKNELRWLGLWLDPKLTFGAHIGRMQQRGKTTIAHINQINRCYWGTNPRETKNLIMAVLKPRILFGCIVWFNTKTEGKVTKIFKLLQNAANRLALGAFKSSPTELMSHNAGMHSFKNLAIKYNHNFVYKRLIAPNSHPTRLILNEEMFKTPRTLLSPMHRILRKTDMLLPTDMILETIYPYPDPPWQEPGWEVSNVDEKREIVKEKIPDQIVMERDKGACVIFTNGSFIPSVGGGAAAAMEEGTASMAYGPTIGISNYEMEVMGLIMGLMTYSTIVDLHPNKFKAVALFSDSQAALGLLANPLQPQSLQYLARTLRKTIRKIPQGHSISLYWTPGHEGIQLNEKADEEARQKAEGKDESTILPISLGGLLRHTKENITRGARPITKYKTKSKHVAEALNRLEKGQAAVIFQLRCGHNPLRHFLHRIGVEETDKCDFCRVTENTTHFLIYCRRFKLQRQTFQKKLIDEEINVDINSANKLLDTPAVFPYLAQFVEDTGRFTHLKTYIDK